MIEPKRLARKGECCDSCGKHGVVLHPPYTSLEDIRLLGCPSCELVLCRGCLARHMGHCSYGKSNVRRTA